MKNSPTSDEVKKIRTDAGLTQRQCSKIMGCSENTWQNWEYGTHRMKYPMWVFFKQEMNKFIKVKNG